MVSAKSRTPLPVRRAGLARLPGIVGQYAPQLEPPSIR